MWLLAALVVGALLCQTIFYEFFLRKSRARRHGQAAGVPTETAARRQQVSGVEAPREAKGEIADTSEPVEARKSVVQ